MMNQSTSIKEGMAAWRETITECDRCHCGQLMPHEDGLQCFNCNHIIYYGIIEEKADREETPAVENKTVSEKEPSAAPAVEIPEAMKPDNWSSMSKKARGIWYQDHKDEILRDYQDHGYGYMTRKWGISGDTFVRMRKSGGIATKRKYRRRADKVHTEKRGKPARPLPVDSPVLVITNNDLTDCSDEKLAQIWNTMGLISTRAG